MLSALTTTTVNTESDCYHLLPFIAVTAVVIFPVLVLYLLSSSRPTTRKGRVGSDQQTSLVIGGGLAGLAACVGLRKRDKSVKIVLVEPKEYFECIWSSYRSIFDEYTADASLFDLSQFCQKYCIQHVREHVTKLMTNTALLSNGDTIHFDVAFVAVGAKICHALGQKPLGRRDPTEDTTNVCSVDGGSMLARKQQLKAEGEKLIKAPSVVIVGGGIVGCELAGDLIDCKNKLGITKKDNNNNHSNNNNLFPVTLIHSGSSLCSRECSTSASRLVYENLLKAGVRIILNEKAIQRKDGTLHLSSLGRSIVIEADEIIWSTGISPMNGFMDPALLNEKGWIPVDKSFRIEGAGGHMFAAGDCCTLLQNCGSQVLHQTDVFGRNLKKVLDALHNC